MGRRGRRPARHPRDQGRPTPTCSSSPTSASASTPTTATAACCAADGARRQRRDARAARAHRGQPGARRRRRRRAERHDGRARRRHPRRARRRGLRATRRSSPTARSSPPPSTARSARPPTRRRPSATAAATRWTPPTATRRCARRCSTSRRAPTSSWSSPRCPTSTCIRRVKDATEPAGRRVQRQRRVRDGQGGGRRRARSTSAPPCSRRSRRSAAPAPTSSSPTTRRTPPDGLRVTAARSARARTAPPSRSTTLDQQLLNLMQGQLPARRRARTPRVAEQAGIDRGRGAGRVAAAARRPHHPPGHADLRHARARLRLDARRREGRPRAPVAGGEDHQRAPRRLAQLPAQPRVQHVVHDRRRGGLDARAAGHARRARRS